MINNPQERIVSILIQKGNNLFKTHKPRKAIETHIPEASKLVNAIHKYPHAFVLGCVMDRQMKAERAWSIPFEISKEIDGFEFHKLLNLTQQQIKSIFRRKRLHRFNDIMAKNFYLTIKKIHSDYDGDASNIWSNSPRSATVVRRFLKFHGVGIKIATMAVNILARDFKVPLKDYICIDISPDVHVKRVFKRLGFIQNDAGNEELIYCARELHPEYPGIFDLSCWEIGRNWCSPKSPNCNACYLKKYCPKEI